MINQQSPSPPSLPTVSPLLLTTFNTLSGGDVRLFKQVYLAVWRFLWPVSRFDVITLAYLIPGTLAQVKPKITVYQWFMLCKLYFLTSGGGAAVDSCKYPFTTTELNYISKLINAGLIHRTTFDPAHPHAVKPSHINNTFISFTVPGITFYKAVVKEIHRTSHIDTYRLSVGRKTKGPDS